MVVCLDYEQVQVGDDVAEVLCGFVRYAGSKAIYHLSSLSTSSIVVAAMLLNCVLRQSRLQVDGRI